MMNLKTTRLLFGGAFAMGLLGCGGPSGEPLTSQNIGLLMGQFATVIQGMPTSNNVPNIPISGVTTMSSIETMATDCETITPSPLIDADSDQIAAKKVSTFNCSNLSTGSGTYTRKGSVTVIDKDDSLKGLLGGVRVEFNVPTYDSVSNTGSEFKNSYQGFWDYSAAGTGFKSTSDFTGYVKYTSNKYENDYTYNYTGAMTVMPTSGTLAWGTSDVKFSFNGTYALSGKFIVEVNNVQSQKTGTFYINYYSKDMLYAGAGCQKLWRSGSYFIEDSLGTVLEIRYSCATAQLYVNGQASDLYKP